MFVCKQMNFEFPKQKACAHVAVPPPLNNARFCTLLVNPPPPIHAYALFEWPLITVIITYFNKKKIYIDFCVFVILIIY
jgi:hypothetical protein